MGPLQLCSGFPGIVLWPWIFVCNDVNYILILTYIYKFLFAKQEVFRVGEKIWLGVNGRSAMWENAEEDSCSLC